jgi:hypothetical protein
MSAGLTRAYGHRAAPRRTQSLIDLLLSDENIECASAKLSATSFGLTNHAACVVVVAHTLRGWPAAGFSKTTQLRRPAWVVPRSWSITRSNALSCRRSQWVIATLHDLRFGGGMGWWRMGRSALSPAEVDEVWRRWRSGQAMKVLAPEMRRNPSTVRDLLKRTGGIRPLPRRRWELRLSLAEREEISRGGAGSATWRLLRCQRCPGPASSASVGRPAP